MRSAQLLRDRERAGDAAALQIDISRRLGLLGPNIKSSSSGRAKQTRKPSSTIDVHILSFCPSCRHVFSSSEDSSNICNTCGYILSFFHSENESSALGSRAQIRGLIPEVTMTSISNKALTPFDWEVIEESLSTRSEAYCPICMEGFSSGYEVLLSCSHMFHRNCLLAFERHIKSNCRSCPMCRTQRYQKRITHQGSRAFEIVCAVRVQSVWRGHRARCRYFDERKKMYGEGRGDRRLRKEFYTKELKSVTSRLGSDGAARERAVDAVLDTSDEALRDSRALDAEFEAMLLKRYCSLAIPNSTEFAVIGSEVIVEGGNEEYAGQSLLEVERRYSQSYFSEEMWAAALEAGLNRGAPECAICMVPLSCGDRGSGAAALISLRRRAVLLSCSHLFHDKCMSRFELFSMCGYRAEAGIARQTSGLTTSRCPVCRTEGYQKRLLALDHMHFI